MKKLLIILLMFGSFQLVSYPENPVIRNKGVNDPHIRIIDGKAYLAASHDKSIENKKMETEGSGFVVGDLRKENYLIYPNIKGLSGKTQMEFSLIHKGTVSIEIRKGSPESELIGKYYLKGKNPLSGFRNFTCSLPEMPDKQSICLVFRGKGLKSLQLDSFLFK